MYQLLIAFLALLLTGSSAAGDAAVPERRAYHVDHCPFDPHDLPPDELRARITALTQYGTQRCAGWCLRQVDPNLRAGGLRALIQDGPLEAAFPELTTGEPNSVTALPPDALAEEVVRRLIPQLLSEVLGAREQAAIVLGIVPRAEAIPALVDRLSDTDRRVRMAAIMALGAIRDARVTVPLAHAARDPDFVVAGYAAHALATCAAQALEHGDSRPRNLLIEIMDDVDVDGYVRGEAATGLGHMTDPVAAAAVKRYQAEMRSRWQRPWHWSRALGFGALLYAVAFGWSRIPRSASATAGYIITIATICLVTLMAGRRLAGFYSLALLYPLGFAFSFAPVRFVLLMLGHNTMARDVGRFVLLAIFVMWGAQALIWVVFWGVLIHAFTGAS